jgi:hypothetical protein
MALALIYPDPRAHFFFLSGPPKILQLSPPIFHIPDTRAMPLLPLSFLLPQKKTVVLVRARCEARI